MKRRDVNLLRLGRPLAMRLLMAAGLGMPAAALGANACSASVGKVNINEYNYFDHFTEVKKLDAGVDMTGWKVTVYTSNKTTSGALPTSGANSCFGGVYQVNQFGASQTSQNADIVLFDSNNDVVDILRVRTANTPFTTAYYQPAVPACGFVSSPYDLQVSAANKGVDRTPDGSGPWRNTPGTGANSFSTECGGNAPGAAPGSFNAFETATAAGATSGVIKTKIAGSAFGLDVVAISGGAQESTFSDAVKVELLGNATTGVGLDANNCPTSFTLLQTIASANIANGRSSVGFAAVGNAWRDVRVRISYPAGSPTSTSCSTDNFAIRPKTFTVTSSNANADASGSSTSALPTVKASASFTLIATAVAGYNGTPKLDASKVSAHVGATQTGTVMGTFGAADGSTGISSGTGFTYDEVGYFRFDENGAYDDTFTVVDQATGDCTDDFSNTIVSGKYGCKFGNTSTTNYFGRFIPDHFSVTPDTLTNRQPEACSPVSTFTYAGEKMRVAFKLSARNGAATPAVTKNYTTASGFARLDGTHIEDFGFGAIDLADLTFPASATALTGSLGLFESSGDWVAGEGSFTADLRLNRSANPDGPYASFRLGILPKDADDVSVRTPDLDLDTTVPHDADDRVLVGSSIVRFGRLRLSNAHGSELLDLPVPIETQYWNGSGFARNTADSCTQFNATDVSLSNWQRDLNPGDTSVSLSGRFDAGRGKLKLSKPGTGNTGSVDLALQLGAASQTWLQGAWTGVTYDQDPAARASFGLYRGSKSLIYLREMY